MMSRLRVNSSPDLIASSSLEQLNDNSALEGVAANIKLLLKLIEEQKNGCNKDGRRMLRAATMMTILDNVRTRIHKSSECNTIDESEKLRKQLNASQVARKSLEIMCSSLGKEKEIMAAELSKKAHELNEMEDFITDLKEQNQSLVERIHLQQKETRELQGNVERNKTLSEQLLRSLDAYRSMKRKWKDAQAENSAMHATMEEITAAGLTRIHSFKEQIASQTQTVDIQEEIVELEHMFECFQRQVAKYGQNQGECAKLKSEINACKPTLLA